MKLRLSHLGVIFMMMFLMLGARCGGTRIESGMARDTIFSVEHHKNGATSIWLTHDDIVGYCTGDDELGEEADTILQEHSGEVVIRYHDINYLSDEEASAMQSSSCGSMGGSADTSGTEMVVLTSIEAVPARVGQ